MVDQVVQAIVDLVGSSLRSEVVAAEASEDDLWPWVMGELERERVGVGSQRKLREVVG